jgi:hypothetical protein
MLALRYAYLLALVVWLGGMIILGALVAPATFGVLQASDPVAGRQLAGDVFGAIRLMGPKPAACTIRIAIVTAMLGVALYSGVFVLRDINTIQQVSPGGVSQLTTTDPRRARFDELHQLSTRLMMLNLAGALLLLYWEAREK